MSEHCEEQGFPSQNLSISSVEGSHSLWMLKGNETANVIQIKESVFVFPLLIEQNWPRQHPHQPSGHISLKRLHFCKISSKNMQDLGKEVHYQNRKIFLQHLGAFYFFLSSFFMQDHTMAHCPGKTLLILAIKEPQLLLWMPLRDTDH